MIRGVVEGFYGPPWTHAERLDLIRFCGDEGLTTWVHAPKDDPFHRVRWREPYPLAELDRLTELGATARSAGVTFVYAIAPGLSIDLRDEHDFDLLVAKCEQMRAAGADSIHLLWDDIENRDGPAHAEVSNRLAAELAQQRLVVCPVGYANTEDTPYRRSFAAELDPDIVVYWTGPEVVSHAIAREELDVAVARFAGHELLLWDNFPVNDFAPELLFVGPLRGRDPRLFDGPCAGLVANGMLQAIPSKLPLATVADFLRDPHGYDPATSFARALDRYGDEVLRALGTEAAPEERPDDLFGALALGVDAATAAAWLR